MASDWVVVPPLSVPTLSELEHLFQLPSPPQTITPQIPLRMLPRLDDDARTMLLMRLTGFEGAGWLRPKDWLVCHVMDDRVITCFCFDNDSGLVEDEKELFPSDGLVAQLRILRK